MASILCNITAYPDSTQTMSVDEDHEPVLRLVVSHRQNDFHHSIQFLGEQEELLTLWGRFSIEIQFKKAYSKSQDDLPVLKSNCSIALRATVLLLSRPSDPFPYQLYS